jgi:Holliday junction resolvasome RuvABC DNA-binding subunit
VPVDTKTSSSEVDDAVEALMSLGYQRSDIMLAISATDDLEGLDSGKIMKKLLKKLI